MVERLKLRFLSVAKLQAVFGGLIGLVFGVLYSFGGLVYDVATTGGVNKGTALAFFALVGMPAIFAVAGFALGLVEAALFNALAKWIGAPCKRIIDSLQ